jgi:hypothetical protein
MYACLTDECVLMPTTCMQQARGCTLHYYGLTPDVDSDVDCVNQCIAYWTLTRGMCYDCAWLSLTALSTVTRNLWL